MTDEQIYRIMQITTTSNTHYSFGCSSIDEFKKRKETILSSETEFVDIVDTCSIKKELIESIEYFEREAEANE